MSLQARFRIGMTVQLDGLEMRVIAFSPGGNYVHVGRAGNGCATALSESDARKRVVVPGEDPDIVKLTDRERLLYEQIKSSGGLFMKGSDVRTARRLSKVGLVQLDDNGFMQRDAGSHRSDGERWFAKAIAR